MSVLEWKQINLFDLTLFANSIRLQHIKSKITTQCYNTKIIVFCDALGLVHVYFRTTSFKELISFKAHSKSIKLCGITDDNIVVTLEQETTNRTFLQLFNMNKITKRKGAPFIGSCELATISTATVVGLCSLDNQVCIAIGFKNGDILFHRGPVLKDLASNFKQLTICVRSIIGIEFWQRDPLLTNMFICSDAGVFCYTLSGNNTFSETKVTLDTTTVPSQCCTLYTGLIGEAYFTVGRDDAVYCFTIDGRGPCYAIKGRKKCLAWFGSNLIIVMDPLNTGQKQKSALIVIDVFNKIVVFYRLVEAIANIVVENVSTCYIVTKTNEVFVLRERNQQSKIHLLINKNMYNIALRMLENSYSDHANMAYVNMQYGKYLQLRGHCDEAVEKYIKTIGIIDPYYIIRKMLGSKHSKYLTQYLSKLVQSEYGKDDHKALLRSCNEHLDLLANIGQLYLHLGTNYNSSTCSDAALININGSFETPHSVLGSIHDKSNVKKQNEFYEFLVEHAQMSLQQNSQMIKTLKIKWEGLFGSSLQFVKRVLPLLINIPESCISFLEYIIESSKHCDKYIYDILLQLYLHMWCVGQMKVNELLNFLKASKDRLTVEHALILFTTYSFRPGILLEYEKSMLLHLCVRYLIKSPESKLTLLLPQALYCGEPSLDMWMDIFKKGHLLDNSSKPLNYWLNTMLQDKQQSHVLVMKNIFGNKELRILHIKDIFNQGYLQQLTVSTLQKRTCKQLQEELQELRALLLNYFLNPIEFRNNTCDKCKQQLNLPAVFFICQHSFHKECVSTYSKNDGCVTCLANNTYKLKTVYHIQSKQFENNAKYIFASKDLIENVSIFLSSDEFEQSSACNTDGAVSGSNEVKLVGFTTNTIKEQSTALDHKQWLGRFSIKDNSYNKQSVADYKPTANPFIDNNEIPEPILENPFQEYDANLNPFNQKLL